MKNMYQFKKTMLATFLSLSVVSFTFAQDCSSGRYLNEVFQNFSVMSDVQYGSNLDRNGNNVDLFADIYTPDGDTEVDRPLLIVAHGGSFVGGSKTGTDVVPICEAFVKRGFVVASISYRLGMPLFQPEDSDAGAAVMRATQDAKAAVRFFRNSALNDGNPYEIDEAKIMMCGVSAGGFMAVHLEYLDLISEIPPYIDMNETGLSGGLEGDSGTPGISSDVIAIVNIAGALGDIQWMENTDAPILSFHGDQDGTVPFGTDTITFLGLYDLMEVAGSSSIHLKADSIGLYNCFKPHYGADHVPHVDDPNYLDTTVNYMKHFLVDFACDNNPVTNPCDYVLSSKELSQVEWKLFPNPTFGEVNISSKAKITNIEVIDLSGKIVESISFEFMNNINVNVGHLNKGLYIVKLHTDKGIATKKLLLE